MIRAGTVLFASDDSEAGQQDGREYIKRFGLTAADVKFVRREGMTIVEAKRNLELIDERG